MVECDRIPYMNLVDWVVYNLRVYAIESGAEDATIFAASLLGDYGWDRIMLYKVNGRPLIKHLLKECIKNPVTRDEDEWDEYMRCIEEKLSPVFNELEPGLRQVMEGMKKALKESLKKVISHD